MSRLTRFAALTAACRLAAVMVTSADSEGSLDLLETEMLEPVSCSTLDLVAPLAPMTKPMTCAQHGSRTPSKQLHAAGILTR